MTKDQQIRLLCEQQDQLNEEARKQKAEVSRLKAELASCQGLLDRSIAELAARTEERAELAAALAFAVECARAAGYTGTLREPPVALAAVTARAKAEGLRCLIERLESIETMYRQAGDWAAEARV